MYVERAAPETDERMIFEELYITIVYFWRQTGSYLRKDRRHPVQVCVVKASYFKRYRVSRYLSEYTVQSGMQCKSYLLSPCRAWVFVKGVKLYPVRSCHLVSYGRVNISASTACSSFSSSGLSWSGSVSLHKSTIRVRTYTSSVP